jgi:LPXTG-motif cell wall-anchored protein
MRTRLRLGAAGAVALGALLLATVLASPALAWDSTVTANAFCKDDMVRVHWTVTPWEQGHKATVDVSYQINGGAPVVVEKDHPLFSKLTGNIDLANDTAGEITVTVVTHWTDSGKPDSTNTASDDLPKPGKCKGHESTSSSTTPPSSDTLPTTTSPQETTTTAAVGGATSTTGGQLPFTGASSAEPMLLVGIALLGGGALVLLLTRRGRNTAS